MCSNECPTIVIIIFLNPRIKNYYYYYYYYVYLYAYLERRVTGSRIIMHSEMSPNLPKYACSASATHTTQRIHMNYSSLQVVGWLHADITSTSTVLMIPATSR